MKIPGFEKSRKSGIFQKPSWGDFTLLRHSSVFLGFWNSGFQSPIETPGFLISLRIKIPGKEFGIRIRENLEAKSGYKQSWLRDGIFSGFWARSKNPEDPEIPGIGIWKSREKNPKIPRIEISKSGFENPRDLCKIPGIRDFLPSRYPVDFYPRDRDFLSWNGIYRQKANSGFKHQYSNWKVPLVICLWVLFAGIAKIGFHYANRVAPRNDKQSINIIEFVFGDSF